MGLRRAREGDVLELLLGRAVFCGNSAKAFSAGTEVAPPPSPPRQPSPCVTSPLSKACRESRSSKSSEEDTVLVDGAFSSFLEEFP